MSFGASRRMPRRFFCAPSALFEHFNPANRLPMGVLHELKQRLRAGRRVLIRGAQNIAQLGAQLAQARESKLCAQPFKRVGAGEGL